MYYPHYPYRRDQNEEVGHGWVILRRLAGRDDGWDQSVIFYPVGAERGRQS